MSSLDDNDDTGVRFQKKSSGSPKPSCLSMVSYQSMGVPIRFGEEDHRKMMEDEKAQSSSREEFHVMLAQKKLKQEIRKKQQATQWQQNIKSKLQKKYQKINEGIPWPGNSRFLRDIYTNLYFIEGGCGEINNEHEVRCFEKWGRPPIQESPIKSSEIFELLPGNEKAIRTVLTKGIAGIGKTVSVQKFILDWAEGKSNPDLLVIFPIPFRELNFLKKRNLSLLDLLHCFFPETKDLELDFDHLKVLFIFDGLDECRLPLDFQNNKRLSDLNDSTSVDVLLTNLIKGNLLPSALLWITSRPAATNQIPLDCFDRVTEVRGFNDIQKDEYFRKNVSDQILATQIIAHLKSSRSLYIMCHIPVFCWLSATVLERLFMETRGEEVPKTLVQMFTHFLALQIKLKTLKYHEKVEMDSQSSTEIILRLGNLAFHQLEKGNLIFYEEDLKESGIDVRDAAVYSGVCTQIFIEEFTMHLGKMYSFVHLSVQEHIAAVYAILSCINGNISGLFDLSNTTTLLEFLKTAVDKALQSKNGHLDLFLRFLLGLSLESNQILLQGLLTQNENSTHCRNADLTKQEMITYIKQKISENPLSTKSINLFHCLNEMNDQSLVQEVKTYLNINKTHCLQGRNLSPDQWSALVFVILSSEDTLEEFNLEKYDASEKCLLNLLPVVKQSRKALLRESNLTEKSCVALASVLNSNCSCLKELDLSDNKLGDVGVEQLSVDGLVSSQCKLEVLRLEGCGLTEKSCEVLALVFSSWASCLKELHLSHNNLQDSGARWLSEALQNPHCKLQTLRLFNCQITEEGCTHLISALISNPSHLNELDLGCNKVGDRVIMLISDLLKNPWCGLKKLKLHDSEITEEGRSALYEALRLNLSSKLTELTLSADSPEEHVVNLFSKLVENTN